MGLGWKLTVRSSEVKSIVAVVSIGLFSQPRNEISPPGWAAMPRGLCRPRATGAEVAARLALRRIAGHDLAAADLPARRDLPGVFEISSRQRMETVPAGGKRRAADREQAANLRGTDRFGWQGMPLLKQNDSDGGGQRAQFHVEDPY